MRNEWQQSGWTTSTSKDYMTKVAAIVMPVNSRLRPLGRALSA